jgi:RNA-binding protein
MPSSPLRRTLRAAGHHLDPVVQVGKDGVTDAVLRQLDDALAHHELVKLKVGTESPEDRFEAAEAIASTGAAIAQVLGRTILAYRRHPKKPRFEAVPLDADDEAEAPPPARAKRAPARRPAGRGGEKRGGSRGGSRAGAGRASSRGGRARQ